MVDFNPNVNKADSTSGIKGPNTQKEVDSPKINPNIIPTEDKFVQDSGTAEQNPVNLTRAVANEINSYPLSPAAKKLLFGNSNT